MKHLLAILFEPKILHYLIWQKTPPMNPKELMLELKNKTSTTAKVVL
jgi:hypothetical protein